MTANPTSPKLTDEDIERERGLFEAWAADRGFNDFGRWQHGDYITVYLQARWRVWLARASLSQGQTTEPFQDRVQPWMLECFGAEIAADRVERGDRLLEEVLELLQSGGYDPARVLALRDYVWSRSVGEPSQEVGGVMITLAAFCLAHGLDMHEAGETELARIWTKVEKIRAKQASKPTGSALPIPVDDPLSSLHDQISALQADLEKARELMREAADLLEMNTHVRQGHLRCDHCETIIMPTDEQSIPKTLMDRLRAAAGDPKEKHSV